MAKQQYGWSLPVSFHRRTKLLTSGLGGRQGGRKEEKERDRELERGRDRDRDTEEDREKAQKDIEKQRQQGFSTPSSQAHPGPKDLPPKRISFRLPHLLLVPVQG